MKLLVAALASELVAFPAEIPGYDRLVTGPGKVQGGVALAEALTARDYEEILVVGTAGAIDPALEGGVYEIVAAIQHDVKDEDGVVGRHLAMPERMHATAARHDGIVIATGDHFVDDADAVQVIRGLGAAMVDMEIYSYLWVAERHGVPIRVLKAISDRAQDGAMTDWDAAVADCSAQLWEYFQAEYPA